MAKVTKSFQYGNHQVTLETGEIARQAGGAVMVSCEGTVLLVSAVANKTAREGQDFFPLTVDYQEKFYAGGRIPGGFFKREGRQTEKETLISRLIDRPIRPLFPDGFRNEVQIIATVMSMNPEVDGDILALIGASAALSLSGAPFEGPIGAAKVGYKDGQYLLNPGKSELVDSKLELVVAGTANAVLMVESEAQELSEDVMLGAVMFGHQQMQVAIKTINELVAEAGKPRWEWAAPAPAAGMVDALKGAIGDRLQQAFSVRDKLQRKEAISALKKDVLASLAPQIESNGWNPAEVSKQFGELEYQTLRDSVLSTKTRIDGRALDTVRPIASKVGILPRVHGSALFTRGETQAIVAVTLGTARDGQIIDAVGGEYKDHFLFHYNFPPYSVGEAGRMMGPKRREIGHGRLAKRGVLAVMPTMESFPYTIRVVSEITESNGSSSMASVCGGSLSMMDAGVPLKAPVAGVAMGLILEDDGKYAVLTDILGDEDHLGDMDFKVAGTENGITSLQMDIKVAGITPEIMKKALEQARAGRLHILGEMNKALSGAAEFSEHAPRIETMTVPTDKIREVIGSGGKVIREIVEVSGAKVDINDDGVIKIASPNGDAIKRAYDMIYSIVAEPEEGKVYKGKVVKIVDFGAFVNFFGKRDGLVHVSQIENRRLNHPSDVLKEGQEVWVKLLGFDDRGKVRLAMKMVDQETGEERAREEAEE